MIFQISNCDFGIKVGGVNYDFEHINSFTVEDGERNRLTRGANAKNKTGLTYRDGLKEPKRIMVPILNMSSELKAVLDAAYENQTRMEVYAIDRATGSSKMGKDAVLSNKPQQLTIDETSDSIEVALEFETFNISEVYK